jgi:hypothetical protein
LNKDDELLLCIERPEEVPSLIRNAPFKVFWRDYYYNRNVNGYTTEDIETFDKFFKKLLPKKKVLSAIPKMRTIPRKYAEFNPRFMQLVVANLMICDDSMILLKCTSGDMEGELTLCQGHCDYRPEYYAKKFRDVFRDESERELFEEIYFHKHEKMKSMFSDDIYGFSFNFNDSSDISYYHLGLIRYMRYYGVSDDMLNDKNYLFSKEKDKNEIKVLKFEDDISKYNPDCWLKEIFEYLSFKNRI